MVLNLEKDIVQTINDEEALFFCDLPYVLDTNRLESIRSLVENAPVAYSLEIKESPCYHCGMFIVLEKV